MSRSGGEELVGFFPLFYNLAETGRAILVAKRYIELGGKVVFFSHGGRYEYLAEDFGYRIVRVPPIYTEELIERIIRINRGERKGIPYQESFLREAVQEEVKAFRKTGVKLVVSFVNYPCSISARVCGLTLVSISPVPGLFYLSIPDNFENRFTRLVPQAIKVPLLNWLFPRGKKFLEPFNTVAKENNLKPFRSTLDMVQGDVTLATHFFEFINVFPNQQRVPTENYVGSISLEELFIDRFSKKEEEEIEAEIKNHLDSSERSILLTMGSSGDKELFLKIINALNKTSYRVVVVYANILGENDLPKVKDSILLKKFVPSIAHLHNMVDLAIIHGGQGTVYTAAYSGKPVIGFPMQFEQHLNLEKMVGHGAGLMLSKKFYKENNLLASVETIFSNYDRYLKHAQKLADKLPKPEGEKRIAKRLVSILEQ